MGLSYRLVCSMIDYSLDVNRTAYMDFREATDALCNGLSHEALAKALGVSVATIRQARLRPAAAAHRSPPPNWREAIVKLAEEQQLRYRNLLDHLRTEMAH